MKAPGQLAADETVPVTQEVDESVEAGRIAQLLRRAFWAVFAIFGGALLVLPLRQSMELWDESRNANNAVEMALRGHWLTPTFGFQVDHWNTKPPLLIWIVALLERLRVPPIVALRLPSELAALAAIVLVYKFSERVLRRPFVGISAALLMMASTLYIGPHMAMTGDYDALLCLWTTIYALSFFAYVLQIQPGRSIALAAAALSLAILTKGVAGVLLLPGLFVYAVLRGRALRILLDWRLWLALLATAAVAALYYFGRNLVDPGYPQIVWQNELGGRFATTNEQHRLATGGYLRVLLREFEPGILLTPLGLLGLRMREERCRAMVWFGLVTAAVFFALITLAKTQIFYYVAPVVPLLSIVAGIGLLQLVRRVSESSALRGRGLSIPSLQGIAFAGLLVAFGATTWVGRRFSNPPDPISWGSYGEVLRAMRPAVQASGVTAPVEVVDPGIETNAHFHAYDPIAQYYASEATLGGMAAERVSTLAQARQGAWVATCDPASAAQLDRLAGARTLVSRSGFRCVCVRR